jgi:mono/diheme cytochrome c family protein
MSMHKGLKRGLKIAGWVLAGLALAAGAFVLYVELSWPLRFVVRHVDAKIEITPERLARGKVLVSVRCAACHYDQKTGALTGRRVIGEPDAFGDHYSRNITHYGLDKYSDGELVFLLRTGIKRDGVYPGPYMFSPKLADEDLNSIIAFLRSDDPWVKAQPIADRDSDTHLLMKMLARFVIGPRPFPEQPIARPDGRDPVALGRYTVQAVGDCFVCHSKDFPSLNADDPEKSALYMGGGNPLLDGVGHTVPGANLTMDRETGIGGWTRAEFIKTVRTGVRPDGTPARYPMLPFAELSEEEVGGIHDYLQTLPPLRHAIPRPAATTAKSGDALYVKYACLSCHGPSGVGMCDLRQASRNYDSDEKLSAFLHDASQFVPGTKMPTWRGVIAEDEFPQLIGYVHALERAAK